MPMAIANNLLLIPGLLNLVMLLPFCRERRL
jgi:UPF0716 family protein affecting phage T7 exclusion